MVVRGASGGFDALETLLVVGEGRGNESEFVGATRADDLKRVGGERLHVPLHLAEEFFLHAGELAVDILLDEFLQEEEIGLRRGIGEVARHG